ncbi:MAG TPA: hypothetical protein VIU61_01255 [Kofleriaceae bacterium]
MGAVTAGTKLGHYECTAALHDELWLARSDRGGHFVLRILTTEQVQDPKFVRMSDAWGSNELHQASIAGIEDIAEDKGIHYIATEYVHGEALVQLLARVEERGKQISLQHVLAIVVAIAEAMHHAHELGIQCSISPAQVLIGYDGVVKVDLGRVGAPPRPAYRPPEQAAGLATDRRSDVYVIGILLYECVTLHRLFDTGPGPIARPSTLRKGLPSEIEKIVMRALATEASDRYVNAGELRAALSQFASKAGMKLGSDSIAAYMKQMFETRELPWVTGGKPSHASRAFGRAGTRPVGDRAATAASPARKRKTPAVGAELDTVVQSPDRNFDTSDSTMEGRKFDADDVTNKLPPGGTEDPTGKVAFLNGDNAKTTTAKIPEKNEKKVTNGEAAKTTVKVVSPPSVAAKRAAKPVVVVPSPDGKVAGRLVPVDPTEETKLPDPDLADETVVSPPPIIEKPAPVKRPVIAKAAAKLPAPTNVPAPPKVAAEREESEGPESEELRIPTMIATPPPPPLVITATTVESGDSTAVVKPLPMPGQRARRPSTAKALAAAPASETTDTDAIAVPGPSRKKILIGAAVAVAIAIPLAIVLWPNPVAEKVKQQAAQPLPPPERPGPIAAGPDPAERQAAEGSAEAAGSSEPTPTEPAPAEPVTEPTPPEPVPPEPAPVEPPPPEPTPGEPKPSVFVPREGSGSAEAPKPKPAPVKANPKPKPRVAATKPKPGKKPVTKAPKGPTYDPDSLFLKKK